MKDTTNTKMMTLYQKQKKTIAYKKQLERVILLTVT